MEYTFSKRMQNIRPSAGESILKLMGTPGLIKFSGGNPAGEAFDVADIRAISDELLAEKPGEVLQYSVTEGCAALREQAKAFFNRRDTRVAEGDALVVTSGSAQIMDLLGKVLCDPGDRVLVEGPTFLCAISAFESNGAVVESVPLLEDGVDLEILEQKLARKPTPKIFYCIPDFNNPTGRTTSLAKRQAICKLAARYGVVVLEDNPYGELRFDGEDLPAIKSFDTAGGVVYAGSFSKIIAPGIRVAVMAAPPAIAAQVCKAKLVDDVHTVVWSQLLVAEVLRRKNMDEYIANLRGIYGRKCGVMQAAIEAAFPADVRYTVPQGGMFWWVELPDRIPMEAFVQKALAAGVALVPGSAFCTPDAAPCNAFRMNFSTPEDGEIQRGIALLGALMRSWGE